MRRTTTKFAAPVSGAARSAPAASPAVGGSAAVRALPRAWRTVPLRCVDGGSEFRAQFEQACERDDIPKKVLPPRRPQFNGVVERHNDTARVEFWSQYAGELTVAAASAPLADYSRCFNHVRPHRSLDMKTPMEYLAEQDA